MSGKKLNEVTLMCLSMFLKQKWLKEKRVGDLIAIIVKNLTTSYQVKAWNWKWNQTYASILLLLLVCVSLTIIGQP